MCDDTDSVDRPAKKECEIEVTPEMIEAGVEEYRGHWLGLRDSDEAIARDMVCDVYRAMVTSLRRA